LTAVNELKAEGKSVEVIYLSGDKTEKVFTDQLKETCFITLPYAEHKEWIAKIQIDGYPYLRFLNTDGSEAMHDAFNLFNQEKKGAFKEFV
jgi:hypothetical protein